ncbi:hypothetical protein PPROV_000318400 [Pycnococcus provasolii]|uniref:RNA methyltransferase n=1 Tax=Pycnococcus provasolii TaxID=41880 RepID=A0A830HF45_9CHLO|nr:hypothetical protein PPROV_000318400 [Pycnococcus provasolii]
MVRLARVAGIDLVCLCVTPLLKRGAHGVAYFRNLSSSKSRRAVRRVPLRLLYVGKPADASFEHVCDTWAAKVRRYCPFEEVRVKPGGASSAKNASADAQRVEEAGRALKAVGRDSYLFVLDERGKSVSSEHLAKLYAEACDKTSDGVVFAIGGPYGWHDDVRSRAQQTISLSPLVLNHQVARIVTLEALYRSWTILNGEPYHH